ncbi:protein kinase domain-containing protein [Nocardia tengchongensis]|uniref:protein kinase domain-containing protein n=1 Tax=Nocardia tengchongensis TaxID=2055889 RepID=UPI00366272D9
MVENDPLKTQRDVGVGVITELSAAGFEDAEEIGRGGFGAVYRCTQIAADRAVAVKVFTGELEENRERFFREQHAMGRLTGHPNIISMLEVGETGSGHPYLVMPYCSRGSLDARIRRDGPQPVAEVLRLGVKMAGALESAHRLGVLHRDVKPANILLTDYGEPALTDLGIAHVTGGFETTSGAITGSPAFIAPEILGGQPQSPAADVYGLGATLFCALTGHAAFERRSGEEVVAQFVRITSHPLPDLHESGLPDDVCSTIEAAMARDPGDRPTVLQLGEQLRRIQLDHGFTVDEMALPTRPELVSDAVAASEDPASRVHGGRLRSGMGNLPLELTSFVDRRAQLSEVKNLLSGSRLVTLTGIGGVGKSRLALRIAHKVRSKFANGAWLIELGELTDAASLTDVVSAAFGVLDHGGGPALDTLVELLTPYDVLLVLDNCEHMIDAVTSLAETLIRACPRLRILATSREALGIGGETVYPLPPLEIPDPAIEPKLRAVARYDAVTLFAERAAAAVPGFEVTDDNRLTSARICSRCEGLPLAIELAAARLRTMSVDEILARMNDRYALLTRGSRGAPKRQQTMQYCIDWSYDLCTPDERRLWRRLSVFAGGFELDAAVQVCVDGASESEVHDAMAALLDKSILSRTEVAGTVRFGMLETVREFGREKAEECGEYPDLCRRHLDWCTGLVEEADSEWIGPRQMKWFERLERELPNVRKALEYSLSQPDNRALRIVPCLFLFWFLRGRLNEGRRWYERALAQSPGGRAEDRAKALYATSSMAAVQGDLSTAAIRLSELRTLAEQAPAPLITALLAHVEANHAFAGSDVDTTRTIDRLVFAIGIYEQTGDLGLQLYARIALGWAYALNGDTSRAAACHTKVLEITESAGEMIYRSWALWGIGFAAWRDDEPDRATRALGDGIRLAHMLTDPLVATGCLDTLAWIAAEKHDAHRAAVLLGAADASGRIAGSSTSYIFRGLHTYRDQCERSSRQSLGARAFDVARQEGASMGLDTAVGFALGEQVKPASPLPHSSESLTARERQVATLVAEGLTNKAIADRLVVSPRTAQGHVEHILSKLGFTSRAQIAAWAAAQAHNTFE